MRRLPFAICCLLPFWAWTVQNTPNQQEVIAIEQKIQALQTRLENVRSKEMDQDVQGQGDMIADWEAYSKSVEQVRRYDEEEEQIEREIEKLKQQKAQLLRGIHDPSSNPRTL